MESLNSNSQERESHQLQQMQDKAKELCMASFRLLHSFLQTFTGSMLLNLDQLEKQLDKEEFQEAGSMDHFKQFCDTLIQHMESVKKSIDERAQHKREYDSRMKERHMRSKEGKVDSSKALDAGLFVTECSGTKSDKQVTSSSSGNYLTHAVDADIRS
ncbi:hypothetical protein Tco_1250979 [Tanacetum coccineum]